MIQEQKPRHPRPYWHIDAKWIAGLLFFASLSACLLFYNLSSVTARDNAVPLAAAIFANVLDNSSLSNESGLQALRQQAAQSKGSFLTPLPAFPNLKISKQDVLTFNSSELRAAIFSQITSLIYDRGVQTAAVQLTPDTSKQDQLAQQVSLLGTVTNDNHEQLLRIFIIAAVLSVLWAIVLISFSAGWGRLVSPGVVLVLATPPGALLGLVLSSVSKGTGPVQSSIPPAVAQAVSQSLIHSYLYALLAGLGLLIAALLGKTVHVLFHYSHH